MICSHCVNVMSIWPCICTFMILIRINILCYLKWHWYITSSPVTLLVDVLAWLIPQPSMESRHSNHAKEPLLATIFFWSLIMAHDHIWGQRHRELCPQTELLLHHQISTVTVTLTCLSSLCFNTIIRYLNLITRAKVWREHSNLFQEITMASDLEVLLFIPDALHSTTISVSDGHTLTKSNINLKWLWLNADTSLPVLKYISFPLTGNGFRSASCTKFWTVQSI